MRKAVSAAERLAAKLRGLPDGCVVWTGRLCHNGYGVLARDAPSKKRVRAHRLAYELEKGPIPSGLEIDHLCRNRACCNPDHLEAVTREVNLARGRPLHVLNAMKTHCKRGHEFTPDNTYRASKGRGCLTCRREVHNSPEAQRAGRLRRAKLARGIVD